MRLAREHHLVPDLRRWAESSEDRNWRNRGEAAGGQGNKADGRYEHHFTNSRDDPPLLMRQTSEPKDQGRDSIHAHNKAPRAREQSQCLQPLESNNKRYILCCTLAMRVVFVGFYCYGSGFGVRGRG